MKNQTTTNSKPTTRSTKLRRNRKEGSVMMEYVIVAVLIAAAVVVGVQVFSGAINNQVAVATDAVTLDPGISSARQEQGRVNAQTGIRDAGTHNDVYTRAGGQ